MPSPTPFEIDDASTASYGKKVSSTYHRYACGTFLPNSLYLHRLFQKAYGKVVYRVQLLKMLNVSERPRTGVVPGSSEICVAHKSRR